VYVVPRGTSPPAKQSRLAPNAHLGSHLTREKDARRRDDLSLVNKAQLSSLLFNAKKPSCLVFVNPATHTDSHVWGFAEPVETVPFPTFKTIAPLYEEAVARDAALVDMTQERYFWTDSADDVARLGSMFASDSAKYARWQVSSWENVNGYSYRAKWL
jgi:hypothetical protein